MKMVLFCPHSTLSWDRTAPASVVPFVGPDGISRHYGGRLLHLGAETAQGVD